MKKLAIALAATLALGGAAIAQANWPASWTAKAEPFRLIDNVYDVGSEGLTALLITTPQGHILLDAGMPSYAPQVAANITALGFKPRDVRWLLNSHAHFDHSGGMAELKRLTGAKVAATAQDRAALESGTYPGSETNTALNFPPVKVDRVLKDGDVVALGGVKLTAHLTPGHTAGCTTWTFPVRNGVRRLTALYYCSTSVAANRLVDRPQYPGIVDDYRRTFAELKTMKADIFLAPHSEQFDLAKKRAGLPGSLVDPAELGRRVAASEADFHKQLAAQTQRTEP